MLLSTVAQALFSSYDSIVANWADITFTYPALSGSNADKTLTFTQGATRMLRFTFALPDSGTMRYSHNSGTFTAFESGVGLTVASGDTLRFQFYRPLGNDNLFSVTINDETKNEIIDTFTVEYTGDPYP